MQGSLGWLRRRPAFAAMYADAKTHALAELQRRIDIAAERALGVQDWVAFREIKREVAWLEGRMGRLAPKTYRA